MNDYKELIERFRGAVEFHKSERMPCDLAITPETCTKTADAIERLVKERDAAVKCIEDIETYLQWGAPQYAYKVIEEWRGVQNE